MMRPTNQNHTAVPFQNLNGRGGRSASNGYEGCREQKEMIRALDFAIQETVLYLDAYPDSQQALAYYHQLIEQRKVLADAYEKNCGPLTFYGNTSKTSWDWVAGPWPWEAEAN